MKKIKIISTLFLVFNSSLFFAQNEFSRWYFGNGGTGLNFNSSPPSVLTGGVINYAEACATISDINGNLLFYTNGATVWNQSHSIMGNGTGILGGSYGNNGSIILKKPGSSNLFYLFTFSIFNPISEPFFKKIHENSNNRK